MKTRVVFLIILLPLLMISCKKEKFPDNEDLKGNWAEITDPILLDQEGLYFDGVETLYYSKRFARYIGFDTLIYRLDKIHEKLYLSPLNSPGSSESIHKIILDTENNELSIWGFHYPDSESKFKKQ